MTEDNRRANLSLELEKGAASLRAAELCLGAGLHDDAVSRAYYAAFHHVQALLFSSGLEARTHGGTHDLFYLHFIRPGHAPARLGKLLSGLQHYREQADYVRAFRFSAEDAMVEVDNARVIVGWVHERLRADGWLDAPGLP